MSVLLMHGHHENGNGCPLSLIESAQSRVKEIENIKPEPERALRLTLLREIDPAMLPAKAHKAMDAYDKARDAYDKAREKAWDITARYTYYKAWAAFAESLTRDKWAEWHSQNCTPKCPWTKDNPTIFANGLGVEQLL